MSRKKVPGVRISAKRALDEYGLLPNNTSDPMRYWVRLPERRAAMSTLLSKKTDYALLILSHLHDRPEGDSAREIADRFGLSKAFLANILKELCQKGFLV